ncbi:MAG: TadE/TadG family type IV pilus assembly protein [Methylocystis sp.]
MVEFAIAAPVFLLFLGGVVDFGRLIDMRFNLSNSVTAAANYITTTVGSSATVANALVSGGTSSATYTNIQSLLQSSYAPNYATANIVIDNGSTAIANFYCPTGSGANIVWGVAVASTAACPVTVNGVTTNVPAGQFVMISATRNFTPFIIPGTIIPETVTIAAVVQIQ